LVARERAPSPVKACARRRLSSRACGTGICHRSAVMVDKERSSRVEAERASGVASAPRFVP
jgi:hypothetical protein